MGLHLAQSGGKRGKKKAVVAVARKLGVLLHRLWVTGEVYEPLLKSQSTDGTEESSLKGFEANRRVRVTAARARNDIAGNRDIQFGSETAAPVSN
jgi:hypothetical protein